MVSNMEGPSSHCKSDPHIPPSLQIRCASKEQLNSLIPCFTEDAIVLGCGDQKRKRGEKSNTSLCCLTYVTSQWPFILVATFFLNLYLFWEFLLPLWPLFLSLSPLLLSSIFSLPLNWGTLSYCHSFRHLSG